jgi:NAD(P)-dependent dehydrogenase (short-subunit alcohol dehydrogenase family)
MNNELETKTAIVTGGARGIGFGICECLGAAGCNLIIADINEERAQAAQRSLQERGFKCRAEMVDVTSEESVRELVSRTITIFGRIDILANSSGVAPNVVSTIQLTTAEWNRVLNVNLSGVFICCREFGLVMAKSGGGRIINIASLNSVSAAPLTAAYNASKAGVVSLTQTLAVELAPFGVNVNAISPGPIETEFHGVVMPQRAATLRISTEQMIERIRTAIPLGRWGQPADVGKAVLFLASAQSDWITGQNLIVAGGLAGVAAAPPKEVVLSGH